jgi:hypothetical protein
MDIQQANGDIVGLAKSKDITTIWIGSHRFIYEPAFGYLEVVLEGKISVGRRKYMEAIYELGNGQKYALIGTDIKSAPSKTTRYYWVTQDYFIFDEKGKTFRSGSRALPSLLPAFKQQLKLFSKKNKIDYSKEEDVLKMVAYANDLSKEPE